MHVMLSLLLLVSLASSVKHCANAIDARGLHSASSITSSDDANDKKKRRLEDQSSVRGEEDDSITALSTHWEDAAHGEDTAQGEDASDKKKRRLEEQSSVRGEEDDSITAISTHREDATHGEDATHEHNSLEEMAVHVSYEDICECCLPSSYCSIIMPLHPNLNCHTFMPQQSPVAILAFVLAATAMGRLASTFGMPALVGEVSVILLSLQCFVFSPCLHCLYPM